MNQGRGCAVCVVRESEREVGKNNNKNRLKNNIYIK
jgi:hypothetical protein